MTRRRHGTLDARDREHVVDHVQRLLVDPLLQGATDAEIAYFAGCSANRVREIAGDAAIRLFAIETHPFLVRPESETPMAWARSAVIDAALAHCASGRCRHARCARARDRGAA